VFAQKLGIKHRNNVSGRLENPNYGNHSLRTLRKIAATCDVALVVWFIPFSRLLDWVTGIPYQDNGLSEGFYSIPTFGDEFEGAVRGMGPRPIEPLRQSRAEEPPSVDRPFRPAPELGSIADARLTG
jgi:hypothetical protein